MDVSTHGAMLVPVVASSDKMTVSVAMGHQEYHPVCLTWEYVKYCSPWTWKCCNAHCISTYPEKYVLPLLIPVFCSPTISHFVVSKHQWKKPEFQKFCCQLYHWCLEIVFSPLRPYRRSQRSSGVLTDIFAMLYSALVPTLLIIPNKYGFPELSLTSVQSDLQNYLFYTIWSCSGASASPRLPKKQTLLVIPWVYWYMWQNW